LLRCARNDGVTVVIPRAGGGSSMPRLIDSIISVSGILDHPLSRAMTAEIFRGAMRPELQPGGDLPDGLLCRRQLLLRAQAKPCMRRRHHHGMRHFA
jgi:hypothetical protein